MRRRRRLLALAGLFVVAFGGTLGVVLATRGDDTPPVEGGSAFGGRAQERAGGHLLDVLGPLLSPVGEGFAATGRRARSRRAAADDPSRVAARLMLVGFRGTLPRSRFFARLRARGFGGVVLERPNYREPAQLGALVDEVAVVSRQGGHGPALVAALQPGGEDTAFPNLPPLDPGSTVTARGAGREAARAAAQLRALGVRMTLAPPANLGSTGGPWFGRAYGEDARSVTAAVRAAVTAYRRGGVAAVPGSFPGEGAASQDPSFGAATVGLGPDELAGADLEPFAAIARLAPAIQMSNALYAAYDGVTPATLLPEAITSLRELGFRGAVVSGDLAATTLATGGSVASAAVEALKAGCDLLWVPGDDRDQEAAVRALAQAIRTGRVPRTRVREALSHVEGLRRTYGTR